jgi:hypothetical protein
MAIDFSVAVLTVSVAGALTLLANTAVMLVVPGPTPVAKPSNGYALLTVATDGVAEAHVTLEVRFCVLRSMKVPVAVNSVVTPSGTLAVAGVTAMDVRGDGVTTTAAVLLIC